MVSTSIQFSLLQEEANILLKEANRQIKVAVCENEKEIANGRPLKKLDIIRPSTIATQIIRAALPELERRQTE